MRKLAAIMFTDIVGYTVLMGEDEAKALQTLKQQREYRQRLYSRVRHWSPANFQPTRSGIRAATLTF